MCVISIINTICYFRNGKQVIIETVLDIRVNVLIDDLYNGKHVRTYTVQEIYKNKSRF